MSNVATLKLSGTSDLSVIARDLKSVATESKNAATPLKGISTSLDQSTKSATSFGTKMKSLGSNFSSTISSAAGLGGSVLNLSRQYADLGDAQIKVDKNMLKVSRTTEATKTAQGKLNDLISKGVTGGAEYEKALLDVKQAQDAQALATTMLGEAQEDQQRQMENFWIGLVPTITTAGGIIVSMIKDIGGTKGLGGLKTVLSGLGSKTSGLLGGLIGGLGGIGSAAGGSVAGLDGMTKGTVGLGTAMKGLALSSLPVAVAIGGVALIAKSAGLVIHEVISVMKGDMLEAVKSMEKMIDFYTTIGSVLPMGAGFSIFTALKPQIEAFRKELEKVPQAIKPISPELQGLDDIATGVNTTIDSLVGGVLGLVRKAEGAPAPLNTMGQGISGVGGAAGTAGPQIDTFGNSIETTTGKITTFVGGNIGLLDAVAKSGTAFVETSPMADTLSLAIANVGESAVQMAEITAQSLKNLTNNASRAVNSFVRDAIKTNNQIRNMDINNPNPGMRHLGSSTNPNVHYRIGGMMKGQNAGGGGHYVTFRGGKQIGGGPGTAPKSAKRKAASGMHETVNQPTWILAGESGKERVDIGKPGSGGFNGTINVFVDGVQRPARYSMGARK